MDTAILWKGWGHLLDNIIEINRKKYFTLREARQLLPLIYRLTEEASKEVRRCMNRIDAFSDKSHPTVALIESEISHKVDLWYAKIEKLGGEPKGLWMADFDNGEGYFCWKFPETEINHKHGYHDGFSGRIFIE